MNALPSSWLTAFILLALDFNQISCSIHLWNKEMVCSRKYAAEAFSFIAAFMMNGYFVQYHLGGNRYSNKITFAIQFGLGLVKQLYSTVPLFQKVSTKGISIYIW